MVDLAAPSPRKSSANSLRLATSTSNLRASRPVISSPIGPPLHLPLNSPEQAEPGSPVPSDTTGSLKKDWINPLDVNFPRDSGNVRPHTSAGPLSGARSPLARTEFDIEAKRSGSQGSIKTKMSVAEGLGLDGYPSPPPSVKSVEQGISRSSTEPRVQPTIKVPTSSSLRRVSTAERPSGLPSPAVSEERFDQPIIRNSQARRDTIMFYSPRRRSFSRQVSEGSANRQVRGRSDQEKAELKKRRQTEGFEGNFAAFNFRGDNATERPPLPADRAVSPTSMSISGSPTEHLRVSSPMKTAQERKMDEPMTVEPGHGDDTMNLCDADNMTLPFDQDLRSGDSSPRSVETSPQVDNEAEPLDELFIPMRPRQDSDTCGPLTPTALRAPPPYNVDRPDSVNSQRELPSPSPNVNMAPPPRMNPDQRAPSPLSSMPPMEGDFPVSSGLPRGRRPDSLSSRRGCSPATLDFDTTPPPRLNHDRRAPSPLRSRAPMEGDFPMSKGLPRGRLPGPTSAPMTPVRHSQAPSHTPGESENASPDPIWTARAERHMSAMPAPLSPMSGQTGYGSDADSNGTPAGLAPPRLPSPTFTSLEESVTENLTKAFGLDSFDDSSVDSTSNGRPLISPVLSEFGGRLHSGNPRRLDATKAPPRPPPVSLPPSSTNGTPDGSLKSPVNSDFAASFI
ncbi:hypothetical protein GMORB2_7218 [Geosmithia morbida]|uniref:Uncharacterized protein n=1 Tax=Geosmithia morbida TaxID=1094350 RepID=A0A9P5D3W2_9HYPO|nr:uncharacterized protein GMORB2_7218 [Geosmithia morbida]KAF4122911.1 hypothetical protein GMORB2_7218 [Geosmithia morbida]